MNVVERSLAWFAEFAAPRPIILPYGRDAERGHVELYVGGCDFCCVCVEIAPTESEPTEPGGPADRHDR